ncbi:MAG TPA: hypothetical protein VKX41_15635 [Alloacidobacterium sp.]|nr:hypothetical protein [Alloacidobacterium sp.]
MNKIGWDAKALVLTALILMTACHNSDQVREARSTASPVAHSSLASEERSLVAHTYNSGFALAHDSYNGISSASDGNIYYILSSEDINTGAQMYSYDPAGKITHLGDLTEISGEKGLKAIPQGKSHVAFSEYGNKLYFATHIGYYTKRNGMELYPVPPQGYEPYPGGHFLSYDLKTGQFENYVTAPHAEGIIAMAADGPRGRLYGLTWPTGYFIYYDLKTKKLKDLGRTSALGESVRGAEYRTLCRSLALDPSDGSVYFTTSEGNIYRYRYDIDGIEKVLGDNMRRDYFGVYDPTSMGTMGYNWRQTVWYAPEKMVYGVHGNSGYLFRFDPSKQRLETLDRITSLPSQRSGMNDEFSYGYLGFKLGPDGRTLHYLTGGPVYLNGKRVAGTKSAATGGAKGVEDLHLVTYDIPSLRYVDHGAIFFENGQRPSYVNSIAIGTDGSVYFLSRITEGGKTRTDLCSIKGPFSTQ